jgi:hypothetical protein
MQYPDQRMARQELEEGWRLRFENARERYQSATDRYRTLLKEKAQGLIGSEEGPLSRAREAESEALAEYVRVLKAFTDLTVHDRMPDEREVADVGGGQ